MAEISVLRFARKIWTDSSTAAFVLIFVSFPMMLIWLLFAPQEKRVASAPEIVSVVDRLGERIGWWDISYPASLRKGDHEPITVTYKADPQNWGRRGRPSRLSVSVQGQDLDISPPHDYNFPIPLVKNNSHIWQVTPQNDLGAHTLTFSFSVKPNEPTSNDFFTINGKPNPSVVISNEVALGIEVTTILGLSAWWAEVLNKIWLGLITLLALPAVKMILKHFLGKAARSPPVR
jgi:hypothetical protein